jgi:PAS domain-containing protein
LTSGSDLREFLENLDAPLFIANGDARFVAANGAARYLAGGDPAEIEGWLLADVFDCAWADQAGGCGQSECCRACLIRDSVKETLASGRPVTRRPAYLEVRSGEGVRRDRYLISTLKAGEAVLLRIDRS